MVDSSEATDRRGRRKAVHDDGSASALPRYPVSSATNTAPRRVLGRVALALVALLAIVGATRISQSGGTNASTPSSDPATEREAFLNDPERLAGIERLHSQMDEGWIPFDSGPAIPGVIVPDDLWVKWLDDDPVIKVEIDETVERQPVYQGKDGDLVGYCYSNRGYLPVELAETFDPDETG